MFCALEESHPDQLPSRERPRFFRLPLQKSVGSALWGALGAPLWGPCSCSCGALLLIFGGATLHQTIDREGGKCLKWWSINRSLKIIVVRPTSGPKQRPNDNDDYFSKQQITKDPQNKYQRREPSPRCESLGSPAYRLFDVEQKHSWRAFPENHAQHPKDRAQSGGGSKAKKWVQFKDIRII